MRVSELIAELQKQSSRTGKPDPDVVSHGTDWFARNIEKVDLFEGDNVLIAFKGEVPPPPDFSLDFLTKDEFALVMAFRDAAPEVRRAALSLLGTV